jgi:uncharacterized protein YecT (DUF1311 family)
LRQILALLALGLASCATPAAQADPLPAEPELLNACVVSAADGSALRQCRGAVARPCIEVEGSNSFSDVLCWSAEADAWRSLIEAAMQRVSAKQTYRDPQRLASAHRAWQAWLESECEYWSWEEGGGSGEQYQRVQCAVDRAAERAIFLILEERR